MAEKSLFWFTDGFDGAIGDGSAPYTQQEFADRNRLTLGEGVIPFSFVASTNSLLVDGTASPLTVTEGTALVRGFHYHSDAIEDIIVATPVVNTTGGRVVLRADYDAATVRLALKLSADGVAAIPALTQIANDVWEINLATFTITTGGVISVDDDNAKSRFAFTRLAGPDGITLDRDLERRFQIADGGVSTAKLADDAVTAAKVGAGVPTLTERQGGSATNWSAFGTTDYVVNDSKIITGVTRGIVLDGTDSILITITFPSAFANEPNFITSMSQSGLFPLLTALTYPSPASNSSARVIVNTIDGTNVTGDRAFELHWIAIGSR